MKSLSLRKVNLNDKIALQKISKQTFLETYSAGNTEDDMSRYLEEEFSLEKLVSQLSNQNSEFYFACLGSVIVGYLKINVAEAQTEMKNENTLEIQRIYVLADYQGKRIGKLLYKKAIEIAQQKEVDFLWLGVWEKNPKAIRFYEQLGFKAFDKHTFIVGEDVQTDIMMKKYF
ncbi:GNAT family N-acetyltransferase [Marivirga harenae]|uniref:GNAT family N-acetyltransferase n=1 Tax=Marivirga harenae TaxID=2010992 RepID=UPI0026E109CE|nr:GNAT family N-acetyltransferase [Marivirga harenae]WKV13599.1 GNAT family N-acetyltransferase [Marivirga harenae]|tara:strand:+ start:239575 stop:240093 length:519 start_codon:yes stop_codon:yes gene_type:complete